MGSTRVNQEWSKSIDTSGENNEKIRLDHDPIDSHFFKLYQDGNDP